MAVFSSFSLILANPPRPSHFWPAVASQGGGVQPTQPRLAAAGNTPCAFGMEVTDLKICCLISLLLAKGPPEQVVETNSECQVP